MILIFQTLNFKCEYHTKGYLLGGRLSTSLHADESTHERDW